MRRLSFPGLMALAGALFVPACNLHTEATGETRTVTQSIDVGQAQAVAVTLEMGGGELKVEGGAAKLMDGTFRFNVPSWEPKIDYVDGARGTLRVAQQTNSAPIGNATNAWTVRLSNAVPIDVTATIGAGEAVLNLGTMNLQRVEVKQGAGEITLDLRGAPKRSYDVQVNGGVGEARIHVPRGVGIVANAKGGLGAVNVSGLEKRGDTWINPGHEQDPVVIRLDVKGGVGEINIDAQ